MIRTLATLLLAFSSPAFATSASERWPDYRPTEAATEAAAKAKAEFATGDFQIVGDQHHAADGDYLNYGAKSLWAASDLPLAINEGGLVYDGEGFPLIKRRHVEGFHFNPITHAQFSLMVHGRYLRGLEQEEFFLRAATKLADELGPDGALRYYFHFRHYTMEEPYPAGWISGMAQGQALSVFARAFLVSGNESYREAGDKALRFLLTPQEQGGPATTLADLHPSLDHYLFFEEYVTEPDVYTLNGYIFVLLGLYDWWQATGSTEAEVAFASGIETLLAMLPLYEVEDFSTYDLSYLTVDRETYKDRGVPHMSASYHALHIQLLHALHAITDNQVFLETAERWRDYVED